MRQEDPDAFTKENSYLIDAEQTDLITLVAISV
jgi:hypothetical protein